VLFSLRDTRIERTLAFAADPDEIRAALGLPDLELEPVRASSGMESHVWRADAGASDILRVAEDNGARFDLSDSSDSSASIEVRADLGPWRLWAKVDIGECGGLPAKTLDDLLARHLQLHKGNAPKQFVLARKYLAHISDRRKLAPHIASDNPAVRNAAMRRGSELNA